MDISRITDFLSDLDGNTPGFKDSTGTQRVIPTYALDKDGNVTGLVGPDGELISLDPYTPPESQYTRSLLFAPPPRQINAVKDLSMNMADGQYLGSMTDADLYDTNAGYLTTGVTTAKALFIHAPKAGWELNNGESLLLQARFNLTSLAANAYILGNMDSSNTTPGINVAVSTTGNLTISTKVGVATGTATNYQPSALLAGTWYNLTVFVDGATKQINAWVNGVQSGSNNNVQINADTNGSYTTVNSAGPNHFGVGCALNATASTATARTCQWAAFRMAVFPSTVQASPQLLDQWFNRNPFAMFSDNNMKGGA